jgi:hypothetical protein
MIMGGKTPFFVIDPLGVKALICICGSNTTVFNDLIQ